MDKESKELLAENRRLRKLLFRTQKSLEESNQLLLDAYDALMETKDQLLLDTYDVLMETEDPSTEDEETVQ